jgi:hypothetical protein
LYLIKALIPFSLAAFAAAEAWVKLSFCAAKKKVWQRKSRKSAGRASAARPPDCLSLHRKKKLAALKQFFSGFLTPLMISGSHVYP